MLHVCAAHGGLNVGKQLGTFVVAKALPSQFYSFNMMAVHQMGFCYSIKQLAAARLCLLLLCSSSVANAVVGGWSLGAAFGFYSAWELEACIECLRAVFYFDAHPLLPLKPSGNRKFAPSKHNEETLSRLRHTSQLDTILHFLELPCSQWEASLFAFTCPLLPHETFQDDHVDQVAAARHGLHKTVWMVLFSDARHFTIGVDHYWDIAHHLRIANCEAMHL